MDTPISVRLDPEIRATLEAEARERKIGLSSYLREVATETARQLQRDRIRQQSAAVGAYVAESAEAGEFYADWGSVLRPEN